MNPRCSECRFYDQIDKLPHGLCRRFPPSVYPAINRVHNPLTNAIATQESSKTMWTIVGRADWCGEYSSFG